MTIDDGIIEAGYRLSSAIREATNDTDDERMDSLLHCYDECVESILRQIEQLECTYGVIRSRKSMTVWISTMGEDYEDYDDRDIIIAGFRCMVEAACNNFGVSLEKLA